MFKKKGSNSSRPKLTNTELQDAILKLLVANPRKKYAPTQIIELLGVSNNKDAVKFALEQIQDKIPELPKSVAAGSDAPRTFGGRNVTTAQGIVDVTRTGSAYVSVEGMEEDVFVPQRVLGTALNRDVVRIRIIRRPGSRPEGVVEAVLERHQKHFIGTLRRFDHYALLYPDMKSVPFEIQLTDEYCKGTEDGDKVVVEVIQWAEFEGDIIFGKVLNNLGTMGGHEYEANTVLINNGFNIAFPPEVNEEAAKYTDKIAASEIAKRRDMRGVTTITIDPVDAKDFDDALSIQRLDNGNIEIGVHIADVSHFVKPNTALDREAYFRSTSVYLVGRVCPMLPEHLSNTLCSLRPHEDKLTFSAIFEFDPDNKIVNRWFGKTVIHSDRRFSYEEVQEMLEGAEGDFKDEIMIMNRLAEKLRAKRFKEGSINFEESEVRFQLDEKGDPIGAFVKRSKDANKLIEDFMLLANREAAQYVFKKSTAQAEVPSIYRVHDTPNQTKLEELGFSAAELGLKLDFKSPKLIAQSLNTLVDAAKNNPTLAMLAPLAIRCMAKAAYSTHNIGHYGLGFEYYTHFTSPIRRYADVIFHRVLEMNLDGKMGRMDKDMIDNQCVHISEMEKKAAESEREYTKYMQAVYMNAKVDEIFEGTVSGFIDRGFFVEIGETRAEGMIPFERLRDHFVLSGSRLQAVGQRKGTVIKLGQKIQVKVLSADPAKRQIELAIVKGTAEEVQQRQFEEFMPRPTAIKKPTSRPGGPFTPRRPPGKKRY